MRSRFFNVATVLFIGDILLTQVALILSAVMRYAISFGRPLDAGNSELIFYTPFLHLFTLLIWPAVFVSLDVYDERRLNKPLRQARVLVVAVLAALFAFAGVLYFSFRDVPRVMMIYFYFVDLLLLVLFRAALELLLKYRHARGQDVLRVLVVGANETGASVANALASELGRDSVRISFVDDNPSSKCEPVLGRIEETPAIVEQNFIDEIIIALPSAEYERVEPLLLDLQTLPVHISIVPDIFRLAMIRASIDHVSGIPLIGVREPLIQGADRMIKRTFDLLLSSVILLLVWPFLLVIAVAIKLDSSGPVFFRQERVGENGQLFGMSKFRTMAEGAEDQSPREYVSDEDGTLQPVYKVSCDPRVTRVGHILRRFSLDELPQLFNVLKGEMSLVGPRPEQTFIVDQYKPWQRQRLVAPPGITGWWQVNGRSDLPMHLNTEYDLFYIRNYSLWLDLVILWRTVRVVLQGRGAY